jgi:hypothetical protein
MATRIFLLRATSVGTTMTEIPTVDGATKLSPPAGLKWTVVELRVSLSAAGEWVMYFDTEKYFNGRYELDFGKIGKPHTVALDVVQPHFVQLKARADTGTINVNAEIVVEEAPAA